MSQSASDGSPVNSTAATSAADEHDNACNSTESLVYHLKSSEKPTSRYLARGMIANPIFARAGRPHDLAKGLSSRTSSLKTSVALRKKRKTLRKRIWTTMESKDRKGQNPFTSMEGEQQVPPEIVFGAFGAGGLEVDEGSRYVSSSAEEKVIAVRVRVGHRTERVPVRDLVRVLETKSVTGRTPEIRAVREFFDWSCLLRNNSVKNLGGGQARGVHQPLFSHRATRVGEARNSWQIPSSSLRFSYS